VAKYDAAGSLLWARQSPDEPGSSNYAQAISTDGDGNSYVAGVGAALLPGLEPSLHNTYIAKYDTLGNLVWAEGISGNGSPSGANGIAADAAGNFYVTGNFATSVTFAPGKPNALTMLSLGGFFGGDIFIAKYDRDANLLWARLVDGAGVTGGGADSGNANAIDAMG